jgi:hypothetical protein
VTEQPALRGGPSVHGSARISLSGAALPPPITIGFGHALPEQHLTSVIIGDSVTGTWLKALAMAPPDNLAYAVEHLNDSAHPAP